MPDSLFKLVKRPWVVNPNNSTIGFCDNSSAQRGYSIVTLLPASPGAPSSMQLQQVNYDLTFTAETHNFPSGVAPFPGAETGSGGRIRDGHATGSGSLIIAGTAGYAVGNLAIPGHKLEWEWPEASPSSTSSSSSSSSSSSTLVEQYPSNLAKPLQIIVEASSGCSDYGNKFGEPLIQGFTR